MEFTREHKERFAALIIVALKTGGLTPTNCLSLLSLLWSNSSSLKYNTIHNGYNEINVTNLIEGVNMVDWSRFSTRDSQFLIRLYHQAGFNTIPGLTETMTLENTSVKTILNLIKKLNV